MDWLPDHVVELSILARVPDADRWLLRFVCRRFRRLSPRAADEPRLSTRRTLDDVLRRAICGGGISTLRFLGKKKPSCVWSTAAEWAASIGDVETFRCVHDLVGIGEKKAWACMHLAIAQGHVRIADFLWDARGGNIDAFSTDADAFQRLAMHARSRASFEWIERKSPGCIRQMLFANSFRTRTIQSMVPRATACAFFSMVAHADLSAAEFVLEKCPGFDWAASLPSGFGWTSRQADVVRFVHERFGFVASPEEIVQLPDHHDALDYVRTAAGVDVVSRISKVPAHETWDFHGYIRGHGRRVDIDIDAAVRSVVRQHNFTHKLCDRFRPGWRLRMLIDARPDPSEWTSRCDAKTLVSMVSSAGMQEVAAEFLPLSWLERAGGFEISAVRQGDDPAATLARIDKLATRHGRCGPLTFARACRSVDRPWHSEACDGAEVARIVWSMMDPASRASVLSHSEKSSVSFQVGDIDVARFLVEELGVRLNARDVAFSGPAFTLELARFVDDRRAAIDVGRDLLLSRAINFEHADIVEHLAPRCTLKELEIALRLSDKHPRDAHLEQKAFVQKFIDMRAL